MKEFKFKFSNGNIVTVQALEKLWFHAKYDLKQNNNLYIEYLNSYNGIKKALTPPTAEEVCKALSEWVKGNIPDIWNYKVYYDNGGFHYYNSCDFEEYLVEYEQIDKTITLSVFLPPHLVTLIGRFYEGELSK